MNCKNCNHELEECINALSKKKYYLHKCYDKNGLWFYTGEICAEPCRCENPDPASYTDLAWREDGTSELMIKTKREGMHL